MQTLTQILESNNLENLESFMRSSFARNMAFFQNLNPKLFKQLQNPPTTHNLYFNGTELNILNLNDNTLTFPKNQMIKTHLQLAQNPLNNPSFALHTNNLAIHKMDEKKLPFTAQTCNSLIEIMLKNGGQKSYHLPNDFLPNCAFYGLLGGIFLQILLENGVKIHSLLIYEEFIDMFRILLYFVDFALLFERTNERSCYIFVQNIAHNAFVSTFFNTRKITNNFLFLELFLYESQNLNAARNLVYGAYKINSRGWGSYDDEIIGVRNTLQNLKSNLTFLKPTKRINAPICVVGNGASLQDLIPFLRLNSENLVIFSCGTALGVLKKHGIEPDFQIEIERIDYIKDVLLDSQLGSTPLLCGSMVNPSALEIASEKYLFMRGGSACAYFGAPSCVVEFAAPFVGNAGFALACLLSEEVLIAGLDCGYIKGRTKHAQGSIYGDESAQIPKDAFEVPSNFGECDFGRDLDSENCENLGADSQTDSQMSKISESKVFSTGIFALSAKNMGLAIETFKPNLVLNLGYGARIDGARACKYTEFDLRAIDKKSAIAQIKAQFEPKQKFFADFENLNSYASEISEFIAQILKILHPENLISESSQITKQALFAVIDKAHKCAVAKSAKSPFVGLLLEGSIFHILHNLMICALHLHTNDITKFYEQAYNAIQSGLYKMSVNYRLCAL